MTVIQQSPPRPVHFIGKDQPVDTVRSKIPLISMKTRLNDAARDRKYIPVTSPFVARPANSMFDRVHAAIAINKSIPYELLRAPGRMGIRMVSYYWLTKYSRETAYAPWPGYYRRRYLIPGAVIATNRRRRRRRAPAIEYRVSNYKNNFRFNYEISARTRPLSPCTQLRLGRPSLHASQAFFRNTIAERCPRRNI